MTDDDLQKNFDEACAAIIEELEAAGCSIIMGPSMSMRIDRKNAGSDVPTLFESAAPLTLDDLPPHDPTTINRDLYAGMMPEDDGGAER